MCVDITEGYCSEKQILVVYEGRLKVGTAIAWSILFSIHPSWIDLIATVAWVWLGANDLHRAMILESKKCLPPPRRHTEDFKLNKGLKIVPFLKKGEYYFIGKEIIERAQCASPIVAADQAADLLENQDKIPSGFRDYSYIIPSLWYDRYVDLLTGAIPMYRLYWDEAKQSWSLNPENIDLIGCDSNTRFLRIT